MWAYITIILSAILYINIAAAYSCTEDGYTYPDTSSCNHYYRCSGSTPVRLSCPVGLVWNCNTSTCQRNPMATCCPNDPIYQLLHPNIPQCLGSMKIPIIGQCGSYKQCVSGKWTTQTCPAGQRFSALLMKCITAYIGKCATPRPTQNTTTTPSTTTTTGTTVSTTSGTTANGTTTTTKKPQICPPNLKIPDVFNCTDYYACGSNGISHQACPSGQYYNCWTKSCSTKKSPLCCNALTFPTLQPVNCPTNNVTNSVPLSCTSYYECVNNVVVRKKCPNFQAFDTWTQTCMSPLKARCGLKPGLTVCSAWFNSTLPFISVNFDLSVVCPKF